MADFSATTVQAQAQALAQKSVIEVNRTIFEMRAKKGANWFFWIAGLSILNSVTMMLGSTSHFVVGLGATEVFDVMGRSAGGVGRGVALAFSVGISGLFILFGVFARKLQMWGFVVGMALYALDALLLLKFSDYLSVGFHGLALYFIFTGFTAAKKRSAVSAVKPANAPLG
jgi:hypothetical protein